MNCLEFRRHCLAEPGSQDSEFLRHKRECPRCADYAAGVGQVDRKLAEALHVDVPANLASRIILRQSIHRDQAKRKQRTRMYALAASVLLTVGLAGGVFVMTRPPSLDRAVIARINAVPEALVAGEAVSNQKLVRVLDTLGAELKGNLGRVSYASIYYVREHQCGQLVIAGAKGPVTVLLMPGIYVTHQRPIQNARFTGVIVPTANGSMAIVGEQEEDLYKIEQQLRSNLTWRL